MTSGETAVVENDGVNWSSWAPTGEGDAPRRKERRLNTATIVKLRKKLMAAEWRRALGRPEPDVRLEALEREASGWRQAEEEKRLKAEAERRRQERDRAAARAALATAGTAFAEAGDTATPERAAALLEEAFEEMGELVDLVWRADGCSLYLEPWRGRRRGGNGAAYLIEVVVDDVMDLAALRHIPPGKRQTEIRWEAQLRGLREALAGHAGLPRDELGPRVEETLEELGRVISFEAGKRGWKAEIEPWEAVRIRRRRHGRQPAVIVPLELDSDLRIRSLAWLGPPDSSVAPSPPPLEHQPWSKCGGSSYVPV